MSPCRIKWSRASYHTHLSRLYRPPYPTYAQEDAQEDAGDFHLSDWLLAHSGPHNGRPLSW